MKSVLQREKQCIFCGSPYVEEHHVFGGANRKNSTKYGLTVWLCHNHHNEPPEGVHFNEKNNKRLQGWAQQIFKVYYPELNFKDIFGKNYED